MEPLEVVLRKVEDLRSDFCSCIKVQTGTTKEYETLRTDGQWYPRKFHTEERGQLDTDELDVRMIDVPVYKWEPDPDTQKKESARAELQQIYDSSEWYSARYAAGKSLSLDSNQIDTQAEKFITDLVVDQLNANIIVQEEESHTDVIHHDDGPVGGERADSYRWDEEKKVIDKPRIEKPDIEKRKKADYDLTTLINMFDYSKKINLYKSHNPEISERAGKALGYSNLRIWTHEHPVATTVTGIAAAGATSGLVYALAEYFSK